MTVDTSSLPLPKASPSLDRPLWSELLLARVDQYRRWLIGLTLALYVAAFNGQWRIESDSALYLTIARNIATGLGYTYHGKPNASAYPGLPYAMAFFFKLMPIYHRNPEHLLPENLMVFVCALATLGLTFRLIRLNAGRPTAVLVTCGLAVTRTFFRYSFALMTDMPFLLGAMGILTGFEGLIAAKKDPTSASRIPWLDSALLIGGVILTVTMRPAWLALVPVAFVALLVAAARKQISRRYAIFGLSLVLVVAAVFFALDPRQAAGRFRMDRYEDQFVYRLGSEPILANARQLIEETAASAPFGLKFMTLPEPGVTWHWYTCVGVTANVIAGSMILIGGIALFHRRGLWGVWIAATIVMMLLVLPHERYFLQAMPLLIFGWWQVLQWINRKLPGKPGNLAFALFLSLGILPNVALCGHIVIEQRQVPFFTHYKDGQLLPFLSAARQMKGILPLEAVVLSPPKTARIMTYLSHRNVSEKDDLALDVKWPPNDRPIYVLHVGMEEDFPSWLKKLGITQTAPVPNGPPELQRVTKR